MRKRDLISKCNQLAAVFEYAANNILSPTGGEVGGVYETYSCLAVRNACVELYSPVLVPVFSFEKVARKYRWMDERTRKVLTLLGVNINSTRQFKGFDTRINRQGARYAWLMFVADILREQPEMFADIVAQK